MPDRLLQRLTAMLRLMVGVKDYDAYLARARRFNPEAPVMSREEFFRYCQKARYGRGGGKCAC